MANSPIPAVSGPSSRLASLDALRGFDLFWICGADAFGHAFLKAANGPVSHAIADQLEHVAWQGFRFYDLIFPLFVFISGNALNSLFYISVRANRWHKTLMRVCEIRMYVFRRFDRWRRDDPDLGSHHRLTLVVMLQRGNAGRSGMV